MANAHHELVLSKIQDLEKELRFLELWGGVEKMPEEERLNSTAPFGVGVIEFHEWLEYVLIFKLRAMIENEMPLPEKISTHIFAQVNYREEQEKFNKLINILRELDLAINPNQTFE